MILDRRVIVACVVTSIAGTSQLVMQLQALVATGDVDEVHLWCGTPDRAVEAWLAQQHPAAAFELRPSPYVSELLQRWPTSDAFALLRNLSPAHGILDQVRLVVGRRQPHSIVVMPVLNRFRPAEMYAHYTAARYPDSVVVKIDDSIAYLDASSFASLVRTKLDAPHALVVVPSVINHCVCAHFQQRCGILPVSAVGVVPYEITDTGKLGSSGSMAGKVHAHFLQNAAAIQETSRGLGCIEHAQGDAIALPFFAIASSDLWAFVEASHGADPEDAELTLAARLPRRTGRPVLLDMTTVAACVCFGGQELDEAAIRRAYQGLTAKNRTAPCNAGKQATCNRSSSKSPWQC